MALSLGQDLLLLLLIGAVVAMLAQQLRIPYSVGLVAAGVALSLLPLQPRINLTKDLIFTTLLPPLIFEAAFHLRWGQLRRELPVILTLATVGVVFSGGVTAAGMYYLAHWPWQSALVFGALIAATDPVSVLATFREARVHGRLRLLIEAESLFNDGTAAVAFGVCATLATGELMGGAAIATNLLRSIGGALLCGAAFGGLALFLTRHTEDHLVELTFTTVAAYGSFLLAEQLHCSGLIATITAGLMMGNLGALGSLSDRGRDAVETFWEYAAFVANSFVFLLIGLRGSRQNFLVVWLPAVIAAVCVMAGRAAAVYPLCALFTRSSLRVSARHQLALVWGGLRGALALALAVGLPADITNRAEIIAVTFGVVAFSVFVQGLTMTPLLRVIGEIPKRASGGLTPGPRGSHLPSE